MEVRQQGSPFFTGRERRFNGRTSSLSLSSLRINDGGESCASDKPGYHAGEKPAQPTTFSNGANVR